MLINPRLFPDVLTVGVQIVDGQFVNVARVEALSDQRAESIMAAVAPDPVVVLPGTRREPVMF